jgi:hypothetical protein
MQKAGNFPVNSAWLAEGVSANCGEKYNLFNSFSNFPVAVP